MYPYMQNFIPRAFNSFPTSNVISNAAKTIPFSTPKAALTTATKASKSLSFSSLLSGAQKGINTLNQIIPLYNQVKPLVQNGKSMLNIFKKVKNTNFEPEGLNEPISETKVEEQEIKKEIIEENNEDNIIFNQTKPSKPFFV